MTTNYYRTLERVYTLLGREYVLLIIAVNSEANVAAREFLLAARTFASEGGTTSLPTAGTRSLEKGRRLLLIGPVVRYDLPSAPSFTEKDIKTALGGRVIAPGVPLVIALVGATPDTITDLAHDSGCKELSDLACQVTGGYLVLEAPYLSRVNLCDKPVPKRATSKRIAAPPPPGSKRFLIGTEPVTEQKNILYAIPIAARETIDSASTGGGCGKVESAPAPAAAAAAAASLVRAVRSTRWSQPQAASRAVVVTAGPKWETLIQNTVERELSKLLINNSRTVIDLGDGLTAMIWPQLAETISMDPAWLTVFTHQSVDPTPHKNYEAFETLGDRILAASLAHYLISEGGGRVDSNSMTNINKEILANERQAEMALTMGLNKEGLIRSSVTIDDKMYEDIFEAFFGCLFTVANRQVEGANQGLPLCEALLKKILSETDPILDIWSIGKDAPTTLDQLFIKMGWGNMVAHYDEGTGVTTIYLTPEARNFLDSIGPPIKGKAPLAVGPPILDIQRSKKAAAKLALSALKLGWGIDTKYASLMTRSRLMKDERYARVQREALQIAERLGFKDIYILRRPKHNSQLYAVIGVRPDDSEMQLHVYKYSPTATEEVGLSSRVLAYITALREFIAAKKS